MEIPSVQFLRCVDSGRTAAKTISFINDRYQVSDYANMALFEAPQPIQCATTDDFFTAVRQVSTDPTAFMIHGRLLPQYRDGRRVRRTANPIGSNGKPQIQYFAPVPVALVMRDFDLDGPSAEFARNMGLDVFADPRHAVMTVLERFAPELLGVRLLIQLSSTCGIDKKAGRLDGSRVKFHAYHRLARPLAPRQLELDEIARRELLFEQGMAIEAGNGQLAGPRDPSVFRTVQVNYTAVPIFIGVPDPLAACRWFELPGDEAQDLIPLAPLAAPKVARPRLLKAKRRETAEQTVAREAKNAEIAAAHSEALAAEAAALTTGRKRRKRNWPGSWTDCLPLFGHEPDGSHSDQRRGFHMPLFVVTAKYVSENMPVLAVAHEKAHAVMFDDAAAQIMAAIDAAPTTHAREKVEKYKAGVLRALQMRLADQARRARAMQPYYAAAGTSAAEARAATAVAIRRHFDESERHHRAAIDSRDQSRLERLIGLSRYGIDPWHIPTFSVVAADRAAGKTFTLVDELARRRIGQSKRYFVFSDNHGLLEGAVRDYDGAKRRHGVDLPPMKILEGQDRLCAVMKGKDGDGLDDVREQMRIVSANEYSVLEHVCPTCPLAAACRYPRQFEEAKAPGVYGAASSYGITPFPAAAPRDWPMAGSGDPGRATDIYGAAIDEAIWQKQIKSDEGPVSALAPKNTELRFGLYGGDDGAEHDRQEDDRKLREILATLHAFAVGEPTWERLAELEVLSVVGEADHIQRRWIDEAASFVRHIAEDRLHRGAGKDNLAKQLLGHAQADDWIFAARNRYRFALRVLDIIRRQAKSTGRVNGLTAVEVGEKKERVLKLNWCEPLNEWLRGASLVALDGSMDKQLAEIVFNRGLRFDEPDFVRIRSKAERALRVKVIGAPVSMSRLRDPACVKNSEAVRPDRCQRDEAPEVLHRIVRAIGDRAGSLGLITYKPTREYLERMLAKPEYDQAGRLSGGYGCMHFGAERGRNDFAKAPVVVVAGRQLPDVAEVEDMAEALATLSPRPIVLSRSGTWLHEQRGIRLADGTGLAVDVPAHSDPFIDFVARHVVNDAQEQAIDRDRGCDPTRPDVCLTLDISDTCPDLTYDAVLTWAALAGMSEHGALLHGQGILSEKPAEALAMGGALFSSLQQAKDLVRSGVRNVPQEDGAQNSGIEYIDNNNNPIPRFCARLYNSNTASPPGFAFDRPNVLHGNPEHHPLLASASAVTVEAVMKSKHRKVSIHTAMHDPARPEALARWATALEKELVAFVLVAPAALPASPPTPDDEATDYSEACREAAEMAEEAVE